MAYQIGKGVQEGTGHIAILELSQKGLDFSRTGRTGKMAILYNICTRVPIEIGFYPSYSVAAAWKISYS